MTKVAPQFSLHYLKPILNNNLPSHGIETTPNKLLFG